ncbi:ABC transporter permease subunit [Actinophytocola oryzae]|uniref:ABC-2 family transporter n=1 Tax=Actinophytocola oryzae TaxID=502181 RepID=A0A4R7VKB5_9PSEU|nr:ABC transporter permease subunit [Actinophytocola oryzae]TDV49675.1 ABC-2 family transporter [Actinophytocola oryzae]
MNTAVLLSEWTKIRTVRSTRWTLAMTLVVSLGISVGISYANRSAFARMTPEQISTFDPVYNGFAGLAFGQIILLAFGVLVVSAEYTSGSILSSLAAVPGRGVLYGAKLLATIAPALLVSLVTAFAAFFAGQAALGDGHNVAITDPGALRSVLGAAAYMVLICAFSLGVATMLRSSVLSLALLIPLLFIVSPILGNIEALKSVARFLPDQAGTRMFRVLPNEDALGPGQGLLVLVGWTVLALLGGYLVLRSRDA